MLGPAYPEGVDAPEVRMYTGYGMNGTIVKSAYDTTEAQYLAARATDAPTSVRWTT